MTRTPPAVIPSRSTLSRRPPTAPCRRPRTSRGTTTHEQRRGRRRPRSTPRRAAGSPHRPPRAPRSVLRSSIAIVIGPTPPGTGRDRAGHLDRRVEVDVAGRPSSERLMPTSITVAPGLIQSPLTIRSRPTAATRTSARRQTSARSRVREWQIVTVALAPSSSCGHRLAEQVRAPDHHRLGALERRRRPSSSSTMIARRRARPQALAALGEQPGADRRQPVDVLARRRPGRSARRRRGASGTGSWQRIPLTRRIGVELAG